MVETNGIHFDGFDQSGSCPTGRIGSTMMSWRYDGIGRVLTDVTRAENIWGRAYAGAPTVPFPWLNYYAIFWSFPRTGYVAAQFIVPTDLPAASWGMYTHGETIAGPATDMAISKRCGDFRPAEEYCHRYGTHAGQRMGLWQMPGGMVAGCELEPGQTYYVNIRLTDPEVDHSLCNHLACQTTVQHNHTP